MSKFNTKTEVVNKTTNLAGGKAFKMDAEQELLHAVLTTFLEDKYYESGDKRLERIIDLIKQANPVYVAKLAYIARKEFNLRSVPIVLLGELAINCSEKENDSYRKEYDGYSLGLIPRAIVDVIQRADEITELTSYILKKKGSLSKQVKRGIRHAILKFNGYQLAKYKSDKKNVKLVDTFNLSHPKAKYADDNQKKAWAALMNGELNTTGQTWESVISASKDQKRDWEGLIKENKLGYMALLRNLNNLIKNSISDETVEMVVRKLTNSEEVRKSKQLPFRFLKAYENVSGNRRFRDAISLAMDLAVSNTPVLDGKTLIAIDCSGSMGGEAIEKASIFGATLAKANVNAEVILYDTSVYPLELSSRIPVIDLAQKIQNEARGGGTNTSLVFEYALRQKKAYDRVIIISDNESWQDSYYSQGPQKAYAYYKEQMSINPYVYAIDIQGYGTKDLKDSRVIHLTGWSNRLLDFIGLNEKDQSMLEYIKSIELN